MLFGCLEIITTTQILMTYTYNIVSHIILDILFIIIFRYSINLVSSHCKIRQQYGEKLRLNQDN